MPDAPIQVAPWTRLFVGRERELTLLREMLLQCAPSLDSQGARRAPRPALAVLVGDSGQGKSRLVQEFYRRIACSPAKGGLDPDDYWPDAFADPEHCAKVVNPELPAGQTVGKTPPFIFWGVRWSEPAVGGAASAVQLTSPVFLDDLEAHRDGCKRRVEKLLAVAGKGAKLAANSLVPGLPDVPFAELVREAIDHGADSIDLMKTARGMGEAIRSWRVGHDAARGVRRRRDTALGRVRAVLAGVLKPPALGPIRDAATPLVVWLDDAQWMTPEECACIHALLREASSRALPLFVIATHWESDWRRAQADAERSGFSVPVEAGSLHGLCRLLRQNGGDQVAGGAVRVEVIPLAGPAESRLDLGPCLDAALPGLAAGQRARVLDLAGGNPLMLRLIVEELQRHPERFESRSVGGRLTPEAEADLAGIAVGEARATIIGRRIRDLDVGVRRVLEMGSLQGSEFLREVTCEAAIERGIARDEVEGALRHASREHAILDEGERTLSFRQDIYRDVLQGALGAAERRAIEAAIRKVLVRRLAAGHGPDAAERSMLNELAARFLAVSSDHVDWTTRESQLWIEALLHRLDSLDRLGMDVLALARAREIVAIDARSPDGIPMSLLGADRAAFVLRVLARFGTDVESLAFGERLLGRLRAESGPPGDVMAMELVMQVAELRGAIAQRALYVASLRGAQAALAEGDPLAARIALQGAPITARGPEHGMLEGVASRKGALLRGAVGGNPYRLRDLPGSDHLAAVFDAELELVPRAPGEPARFELKCLAEGCPAMRLATAAAGQPGTFLLAIGSTAYPGAARGPEVHLHELSRREGAWHLALRWTRASGYWGDATFVDSDRLVMPTERGTIAVVHVTDGTTLVEWPLPQGCGPVTGIVAIDTRRVALGWLRSAAGGLPELSELDLESGTFTQPLHAHPSRINSIAASHDGRLLCVGGGRHAIVVERSSGEVRACPGIEGDVWDVAFSPDSDTLAVVGGDCMVRTFDVRTVTPRRTLGEASGITWAAVWDAQGLAFSAEGGEVILLGAEQLKALAEETARRVLDVDADSGRRLVVLAGEQRVLLEGPSRAEHAVLQTTSLDGSFHLVPRPLANGFVACRLSDGLLEAFGSSGVRMGSVQLPADAGSTVAFAPGGDMLLALRGMRALRFSGLAGAVEHGQSIEVRQFEVPDVLEDWFSCLVRDRDDVPMLGRMDGALYDWREAEPRLVLRADGWMQAAAQLADGGWVCGNHNGRVQRVLDGVTVWSTDLRRAYVRSIACCERNARCYVLMANGPLYVLDLDSGERLCVLGRVEGVPRRLVLGQQGRQIEALSAEGVMRVWRAAMTASP